MTIPSQLGYSISRSYYPSWKTCDLETYGMQWNHLRFDEDIVLMARPSDYAWKMLYDLLVKRVKSGLTINMSKKKF